MSLSLWCVGVELGGGGRRRGEGQVGTCRADGPGAVKGGREVWIEGPSCAHPVPIPRPHVDPRHLPHLRMRAAGASVVLRRSHGDPLRRPQH
jgi:hypothetical protein